MAGFSHMLSSTVLTKRRKKEKLVSSVHQETLVRYLLVDCSLNQIQRQCKLLSSLTPDRTHYLFDLG